MAGSGSGRGRGHGRGQGRGMRRRRGRNRCPVARECTLDCLEAGECVRVASIDDDSARIHALRFGMGEGAHIACVTRIPAGPIVLRSGRQEIAVGRKLAERINVVRDDAAAAGLPS